MDLLRSTIKSLFYDFPLEDVAGYIDSGFQSWEFHSIEASYSDFERKLKNIFLYREPSFTSSEFDIFFKILKDRWLKAKIAKIYDDPYLRIFEILLPCASELINMKNNLPYVKFTNLLRWRDLTYLIGEDLLIIPLLCERDLLKKNNRFHFLWENPLEHDNNNINEILDGGICDTHSHFNAASDICEFNWIQLMNNPQQILNNKKLLKYKFLELGSKKENDPVKGAYHINLLFAHWIIIAAAIRSNLFIYLSHHSLEEDWTFYQCNKILVYNLKYRLNLLKHSALRTSEGPVFDYAISIENTTYHPNLGHYNMIHHGERWLLYNYFKLYFGNTPKAIRIAPYIYLYILIKNKFRREFVQTNNFVGFLNFQEYQSRKSLFIEQHIKISNQYAVQSSIKNGHVFEARITPNNFIKYLNSDYSKNLFGANTISDILFKNSNTQQNIHINKNNLLFIAHFIKTEDKNKPEYLSLRNYKFRVKLRKQIKALIRIYNKQTILESKEYLNLKSNLYYKFVGIDAAGNELSLRPEIFGPIFRYSYLHGITNRTFHAGEDFYDIVDGLRYIDEVIKFCEFKNGDRIGHALALGQLCEEFYNSRHKTLIIPCQVLLDNLVWLYFTSQEFNITLSPGTNLFISQNTNRLYTQIGYDGQFNINDYWHSMCLRGDDPLECSEGSLWKDSQKSTASRSLINNPKANEILFEYLRNSDIINRGNLTTTEIIPTCYIKDVELIQNAFLTKFQNADIVIECNPSSNIKIGRFNQYNKHPIFRFNKVTNRDPGYDIRVTINTDDKGVFATSLTNEYSLIAASMFKMTDTNGNPRWTAREIEEYLQRIIKFSHGAVFK